MTNGYTDIKNTDMMLIMGGNPAENHPCGFKWAIEAKQVRNAKMIVVDPRFTRTAATADLFLQIRAGSDIAFLGGLINYAIDNNRLAKDYLVNYTNAAFIVKEGFKLPEDGLYSGFNAATQVYDKSTWNYEEGGNVTGKPSRPPAAAAGPCRDPAPPSPRPRPPAAGSASHDAAATGATGTGGGRRGAEGFLPTEAVAPATASAGAPPATLPPNVAYDLSLQHPRCVFQLLKRQYSRYTPEMVERVTGIPKDQFLKAADLFTSVRKDGDMKKAATIIYAVGWTQHTFGSQIIRTAAILQLLMGNVGRAGGGVNALRGHSNIQGATDMAGIFDNLPGYLKVPAPADTDFAAYSKRTTPTSAKPTEWDSFNYWSNTPKFAVSFLKAMYGDAATKENDWAFHYLPKVDRNYSWTQIWDNMYNGKVKGMFAFGMNGVAIGPDSQKNIDALKKADWLVVGEIYPDETSEFWKSPGITTDEMKTDQHHRLPPPLRGVRGEGRLDDQLVALAAMEERRAAAARAGAARPGHRRADLPEGARPVQEGGREVPRSHPQPHLGLHRSAPPVALRGGQGDQRQGPGRPRGSEHQAADQGGPAAPRLRLAQGRRHHRLRQLDLLRLLDRGRQPDGAPRDGGSVRPGHLSELGVVLAGQPPRACTTAPPAIPPASRGIPSGGRSGGTRPPRSGSATTSPTSRRTPIRRITWGRSS